MQSCLKGVTVYNCIIQNNRTSFTTEGCNGGGVFCDTSKAVFTNTTIIGNTGRNGGGMYVSYSSLSFHNCIIVKNKAQQLGGALYRGAISNTDTIRFDHSTIVSNEANTAAAGTGGALWTDTSGVAVVIKNSIFWNNNPDALKGSFEVTYSFVQEACAGTGNITDQPDPLFVSVESNNFMLKPQSPCIGKAEDGMDMGVIFIY